MGGYAVKPLNEETWPTSPRLVERHNGVWGGCWCISFHPEGGAARGPTAGRRRNAASVTVRRTRRSCSTATRASAGASSAPPTSCRGSSSDAPTARPRDDPPDWRITCFFVDKSYRHKGVAAAALKGALREIARLGGGTVESSPEDVEGRKVSNSFLYNATVAMFEQQGFVGTRQLGKHNWLVTKKVRPKRPVRFFQPSTSGAR